MIHLATLRFQNSLPIRGRNFSIQLSVRTIHFVMLTMIAITRDVDGALSQGRHLKISVVIEGCHTVRSADERDSGLEFTGSFLQERLLFRRKSKSPWTAGSSTI